MANSPIARGNGDVFELHIHVVFGCGRVSNKASYCSRNSGISGAVEMDTFNEFATVDLARCDFEGYDMVLGRSY